MVKPRGQHHRSVPAGPRPPAVGHGPRHTAESADPTVAAGSCKERELQEREAPSRNPEGNGSERREALPILSSRAESARLERPNRNPEGNDSRSATRDNERMPPQKGTNKPDQSPKKATVSSPKPSAEDATALGSDKGSQSPSDAELLSHIKATRKADMRARHGLDRESRDYLRQQEKIRLKYQPNPTRKQTPTQSAKPSGAKSGAAGRKASSSPKGTSDRHMSVLTARMNVATGAKHSVKTARPEQRKSSGCPCQSARVLRSAASRQEPSHQPVELQSLRNHRL